MTALADQLAPLSRHPAQQPEDDEKLDVRIQKLKIVAALNKGGVQTQIAEVITTGSFEDSTTGAPEVTINLLDRSYRLLNSQVFNGVVDIELDSVPFRLAEVSVTDVEQLELLFEHKLVALLRQHSTPIKANRATTTRAQFVERMLREVAPQMPGLTYISPELNVTQPVQAAKKTGRSLSSKTLGATTIRSVRGSGFGLTHLDMRDWDGSTAVLGPSQLRNAAIVLQVCQQLGAPPKAVLAVCEACVVEPDKPFNNPKPGPLGAGILSFTGGQSWANDVAQSVTHALLDPGAMGKGGMISLARKNPSWSAGQIAQAEQGSAFPTRYDQAQAGAQTVISAFTSAGGFQATAISTAGVQGQYEFSRGKPGQPEDSWTCMQRLASEVNWRCFVAGRARLYFVTDEDLEKSQTVYRIGPSTPGVLRTTFHAELGRRRLVRKGKRVPKTSEGSVDARVDRWEAPPGSVVELEDYGPGNGRWIVNDIQRPLFDAQATITIEQPQKPSPEPAASSSSASSAGAAAGASGVSPASPQFKALAPADRVYAAAQALDRMNLPYSTADRRLLTTPPSVGYDCSAAVAWVLWMAGLYSGPTSNAWVSGEFASQWGVPGKGQFFTVWANAGHVFIEFYNRPAKRLDTVPGGSGGNGPHLRYTAPGSPADTWEANSFTPKHWPGL